MQKYVHLVDLVKSCPNFHFSVSPHVPFLDVLFEQIANSNEYLHLQNLASIKPRTSPIISRFRALGNLNLNFELTNRLFATQETFRGQQNAEPFRACEAKKPTLFRISNRTLIVSLLQAASPACGRDAAGNSLPHCAMGSQVPDF